MQLAKDKRIPYYFVAFFVVLMIVDGIMVTLAVRTNTGTVSEHPYEEGIAYNRTIAAADAQQQLGWKSTIDFQQISSQKGKIVFTLNDAKGEALRADSVTLSIVRPTQDGFDFEMPLTRMGDRYSTLVQFPLQGLWEIRAYAEAQGQHYQQSKRIVVR